MQLSKAAATVKKQTTICTAVWIISAGMGQYMSDALSRQNPFPTVCHPGAGEAVPLPSSCHSLPFVRQWRTTAKNSG